MWMMGYNDGGDSFSGRKLRTLMPRPTPTTPINPPCLGRIHGADLLSFNHHLAAVSEQSKREFNGQQVVVSSRWNPTPEQLQTLEELYRRGTRTPSADQIQHITAQLRRYGKIEGKNVFYWFQNHKARERQKRRRQLESNSDEQQQQQTHNLDNPERKESGGNETGIEVEGTKNWASSHTICNSTLAEKTHVSMQRGTAKAAAAAAINPPPECSRRGGGRGSTDGRWLQFEDSLSELQQRKSLHHHHHHHHQLLEQQNNNSTWHMMQFFGSSSNSSSNNSSSSKQIVKPQNLNIFLHSSYNEDEDEDEDDDDNNTTTAHIESSNQTLLELFPLQSSSHENHHHAAGAGDKEAEFAHVSEMNTTTSITSTTPPQKFFEFLPLKN
ncbi:hypothetical protein M9H77_29059 [Catharanthus roseus]|uniref:Uncharacterized protein n=1 Tax=Catharanthus roseus TaxID=4058 RepID=A0ACC0AHQ4_CATRO|nr:hypothetical protein M9H77_29059 [Catharanthus roseus]